MFSGIVETVGTLLGADPTERGKRLRIGHSFSVPALGESVCVNGACLTVTGGGDREFDADVSAETLRRTTLGLLAEGDPVNLERSLRIGDRLSGHFVFGHVDGVGRLDSISPEGDSAIYRFEAPPEVSRYLVEKGSVAVDGVSLTAFGVAAGAFSVAVIPHTASVTTLGRLQPNDAVNLEADMLAKYVEKIVAER